MNSTEIAVLTDDAMADFLDAVQQERGDAEWHRLARFMPDVTAGLRTIWTTRSDGQYVGLVSVRWQSDYHGFRSPAAPEIIDLYVWAAHRRQGVAARLMDAAEQAIAAKGFNRAGLSVGLLPGDAPAWNLYFKRGYVFDGTGAWWQGQNVTPFSVIDFKTAPPLVMMVKTL